MSESAPIMPDTQQEKGPETVDSVKNSFGYGLSLYIDGALADSSESHTHSDQESITMTREECDAKAAGKPWAVIKHKASQQTAESDYVGMVGGGLSAGDAEQFCEIEE